MYYERYRLFYRSCIGTGNNPTDYGEGDRFIGVSIPTQRVIAKKYHDLGLDDIESLLGSPIHEHRYTGLLILVAQYEARDAIASEECSTFTSITPAASTIGTWLILQRRMSWENIWSPDRAAPSIV